MGLKVNAHGFRLNNSRNWNSIWYGERKYPVYLQEDFLIREYIRRKLHKSFILGSCVIHRTINNKIYIYLKVYLPKYIRYHKRLRFYRKLPKFIHNLTNLQVFLRVQCYKIRPKKRRRFKKLSYRWRKFFRLNKFLKIMLYKPNAELIANYLKLEVEGSYKEKHSQILRFIKLFIFSKKRLKKRLNKIVILGMKIELKGRLNRRARSRKQVIQFGRLPLNNLNIPIQFARSHAITRFGVCGIKVWVAFKPKNIQKI